MSARDSVPFYPQRAICSLVARIGQDSNVPWLGMAETVGGRSDGTCACLGQTYCRVGRVLCSFSISSAALLDLTLTPLGPTYNQGPQGGSQAPLNTAALSDLTLEVFDTNGTSLLGISNATGNGGVESLANLTLGSAGTYYVRVTGADNFTQFYQLSLETSVVPEPNSGILLICSLFGLSWIARRRR